MGGATALIVDGFGKLFIADENNNSVREGVPLSAEPPRLFARFSLNQNLTLDWTTVPGSYYQLEYNTDATSSGWSELGSMIHAVTYAISTNISVGPNQTLFFRVRMPSDAPR